MDRSRGPRLPNERAARARRFTRRGWGSLGFQRQFVMVLVVATLLCTLGTVAAAYLGARASAVDAAQSAVTHTLLVARQTLGTYGQNIALRDGQLYTDTGYRLNGDAAMVDQVTALTGDGAMVYQAENNRLISVAGDLPLAGHGTAAKPGPGELGDSLGGAAYRALLAGCLTNQSPRHQGYDGGVTIRGAGYVAAIAPLDDAQGTCVGALMVATPIERIDAPLRGLAGVLLLIALGLVGVFSVIGYQISGPVSRRARAALDEGLGDVGSAATRVESLANGQAGRASRQMTSARQLIEELRALSEVATAIEHGVAMLRDSTGAIWAELSYPGAAPDSQASFRAARQTAVVASQIGAAAQQAGALCQRLRARMNQVIAEADVLGDHGREVVTQARLLAVAVVQVEDALGNRVKASSSVHSSSVAGVAGNLLERIRASLPEAWQEALGIERDPDDEAGAAPGQDAANSGRPPYGHRGAFGNVASWAGRPSGHPHTTGQRPAVGHTSYGPRSGRAGRPSTPNLRSGGFRTAPPRKPINSGGPQASGSHSGTSERQRAPWFSGGEDLTTGFPREAASQTPDEGSEPGTSDPWGIGPGANPPRKRPTPPTENGEWMNDQA
jgi:hypothetical protein